MKAGATREKNRTVLNLFVCALRVRVRLVCFDNEKKMYLIIFGRGYVLRF